ncbi:MAG TPA: hypothetical protein VFW68_09100 [Rhodocyclaceae bacterium]|nr:hypothetical protein [Rhodocyclaceae bacterium]
MEMRRALMVVLSLSLLAGCANMSPAEQAARAEAEANRMMEVYGPACSKLGYRREEDKWRDCVMSMAARDENRLYRNNYPMSTTCFGGPWNYRCTTF